MVMLLNAFSYRSTSAIDEVVVGIIALCFKSMTTHSVLRDCQIAASEALTGSGASALFGRGRIALHRWPTPSFLMALVPLEEAALALLEG